MKQILQNCYGSFKTINICESVPVLEYLKEQELHKFTIKQVNHNEFLDLQNAYTFMDINRSPIAGYSPLKGTHFRSSGGLKISDAKEKINGSFIVEETRIIYDAMQPFFKERDAFVYGGNTYYTEMSMLGLLKEELQKKRQLLIYMGQKIDRENCKSTELFEEVSEEEFLLYASVPTKGEEAITRRRYF